VILKSEICLQLASEDLQFDLGLTRDLTVWICKYAVVTLKYMLLASCILLDRDSTKSFRPSS